MLPAEIFVLQGLIHDAGFFGSTLYVHLLSHSKAFRGLKTRYVTHFALAALVAA